MKINKLLFITPCVALTSLIPVVSCNDGGWTIKDMEDAIFGPHSLDPASAEAGPKDNFAASLSTLNQKEKEKEVLYALYAPIVYLSLDQYFNLQEPNKILATSLYDLYIEQYVSISANINKCSLNINEDNEIIIDFKGFINFVFIQKWNDKFDVNSLIQITLVVDNAKVWTPATSVNNWWLEFETKADPYTWGIVQVQSDKQYLLGIHNLGTNKTGGLSYPFTNALNRENWKSK